MLKPFADTCRARVDAALDARLPAADLHPARLHEAMRYCVFNGGKRIRPIIVYAAARALGLAEEAVDGAACAIELIHAYSLVHDDLPAMDDDDLRRGKPTCHKAFDEATAILAGDALQTLAFQILAQDPALPGGAERRLRMLEVLALASGSRGMAGGQAIDLAAVGRSLDGAQLEDMHIHKTGALIRACAQLASLASDDPDGARAASLDHYAKCIGLAFQIQDDVLDEVSDTATLGKTQGADRALNKPTYPALLGLDGARERARELVAEAHAGLADFDQNADPLRALADYIIERNA